MPRVARAPAIPPPPPLPALSLVLTGQVYLVSVKKGRLLTKSAIFDSSLGKKGETTNTQTSVGKQNGLVLFTEIFLNYRPSGIWGSYVDSPHLKPPTIHARGRFPGRSLLPTGDRPRQRPFSRLVNVWSGTGWCKATCHPRLGGACEATGLVRIAQAGVAGAAPPATPRGPAPPPLNGQERRLRLGRAAGNSTQKVLLPGRPLPVPAKDQNRCICNCLILRHIPESRFPKYRNRLYGMSLYSVCLISTMWKASMISPILMSLKFSMPRPHSMPAWTSFTWSLPRWSEDISPV